MRPRWAGLSGRALEPAQLGCIGTARPRAAARRAAIASMPTDGSTPVMVAPGQRRRASSASTPEPVPTSTIRGDPTVGGHSRPARDRASPARWRPRRAPSSARSPRRPGRSVRRCWGRSSTGGYPDRVISMSPGGRRRPKPCAGPDALLRLGNDVVDAARRWTRRTARRHRPGRARRTRSRSWSADAWAPAWHPPSPCRHRWHRCSGCSSPLNR